MARQEPPKRAATRRGPARPVSATRRRGSNGTARSPAPAPPGDHGIPPNRFNPHCWITGQPEIGEDTWIGAFTLIDGQGGLRIGRGCNVSCGAQILTHSTVRRCLTGRAYAQVDRKPTVLEDFVFVGTNAVILMGAHIGHHSVIGAGAVVLEDSVIPPYSLVVGVPGRVVRNIAGEVAGWAGKG